MRGSALQDMTGLAREEKRRALPLPLHTLLLLCFRTNEETFIFKFVLIAAGVTEGAMHTSVHGCGDWGGDWHFPHLLGPLLLLIAGLTSIFSAGQT